MKRAILFLIISILTPLTASSTEERPLSPAQELIRIVPEGYSEGKTRLGAPCRLTFVRLPDPRENDARYVRAQVTSESTGDLLEVELFLDPELPIALASGNQFQSKSKVLVAQSMGENVLVRAANSSTGESAECLVPKSN